MTESQHNTGTVYLVGGGPGDPDLITVKGLSLIRRADVIIYDRLAPPTLLHEARPDAQLIDAGKLPQKHRLDQATINTLLIEHAKAGRLVVRLKGGDPFVFGRGGEEGLACREAGVPFEVVPGVSSAIAVPAYAGVPVTHRQVTSAFTVFTGHLEPNETTDRSAGSQNPADPDYSALARVGTLVLLMGVSHLPAITKRLIEAGLGAETPAICIENGTTDRQRTVEGTVSDLPDLAVQAGLQSPVTTVIGNVVHLRSAGLRWFD